MSTFLIKRAVGVLISVWVVVTVVFFVARLTGDPLAFMLPDTATPEQVRQLRAERGFDQPPVVQYLRFLEQALRGDFGMSIRHSEPAMTAVLRYVPATIELAMASLVVAVGLGLSLGILAATRPGSFFEFLTLSLAMVGQAVPSFWLGLMLIMVFAVQLQWLPSSGRGDLSNLILPALTLGAAFMAAFARLTRASMLEQLHQDYVRTARGKGLSESSAMLHALRNASIPLATQIGLTFGRALSGSIVTETIFAWPGVGRFAVQAVYNRDFPVVQATVVIVAVIFLVINLLMDVIYTWLDPRIRLS